jgi:hypothetical protein
MNINPVRRVGLAEAWNECARAERCQARDELPPRCAAPA